VPGGARRRAWPGMRRPQAVRRRAQNRRALTGVLPPVRRPGSGPGCDGSWGAVSSRAMPLPPPTVRAQCLDGFRRRCGSSTTDSSQARASSSESAPARRGSTRGLAARAGARRTFTLRRPLRGWSLWLWRLGRLDRDVVVVIAGGRTSDLRPVHHDSEDFRLGAPQLV
jgi:hypothetical protein